MLTTRLQHFQSKVEKNDKIYDVIRDAWSASSFQP